MFIVYLKMYVREDLIVEHEGEPLLDRGLRGLRTGLAFKKTNIFYKSKHKILDNKNYFR